MAKDAMEEDSTNDQATAEERAAEPRGLGEHARGLTAEYAHEQGWGLEQEQRTKVPEGLDDTSGGSDYEYGARDFGDEPTNTDRFKTDESDTDAEDVGPRD